MGVAARALAGVVARRRTAPCRGRCFPLTDANLERRAATAAEAGTRHLGPDREDPPRSQGKSGRRVEAESPRRGLVGRVRHRCSDSGLPGCARPGDPCPGVVGGRCAG
ncbi:unnamed protein product [Lampetra fluviatilis]